MVRGFMTNRANILIKFDQIRVHMHTWPRFQGSRMDFLCYDQAVTLHTNFGEIKLEIFCDTAPRTAEVRNSCNWQITGWPNAYTIEFSRVGSVRLLHWHKIPSQHARIHDSRRRSHRNRQRRREYLGRLLWRWVQPRKHGIYPFILVSTQQMTAFFSILNEEHWPWQIEVQTRMVLSSSSHMRSNPT